MIIITLKAMPARTLFISVAIAGDEAPDSPAMSAISLKSVEGSLTRGGGNNQEFF